MLTPTLSDAAALKLGTTRFRVDRTDDNGPLEQPTYHRLVSKVPAKDLRPPARIIVTRLQAVTLCIDILQPRQNQPSSRKRGRFAPPRTSISPANVKTTFRQVGRGEDPLVLGASTQPGTNSSSSCAESPTSPSRKRPRLGRDLKNETALSESHVAPQGLLYESPVTLPLTPRDIAESPAGTHQADLESLIDGALRLSLCGSLQKSLNGLKVKANTFRAGLADIAPSIWKPDHLTVRRLS